MGIYGGVSAVASIGAIGSLMSLFNIPVFGIQNGIQPIIGYNHGAGNNERIRQTVLQSILITLFTGSLTFILIRSQATNLMTMFIRDNHEYILSGSRGLKIYSFFIPLTGIINISIA